MERIVYSEFCSTWVAMAAWLSARFAVTLRSRSVVLVLFERKF